MTRLRPNLTPAVDVCQRPINAFSPNTGRLGWINRIEGGTIFMKRIAFLLVAVATLRGVVAFRAPA